MNGKLSAVNVFLDFLNPPSLRLGHFRVQRKAFLEETREVTEDEDKRLLAAAHDKSRRLYHVMLTLCAAGIRVSELAYIAIEAVKKGTAA